VCLKGIGQWSGDPVCLWIPGLTGLEGRHGGAERRSCVCGSPAWQPLGAQPCRVNIVHCCADFGGMGGKTEIMQGWEVWPSERELLQGCAGL
jgi:hypothetical protein